jgi:Bromodomain/PWWP domain/PHD-finger
MREPSNSIVSFTVIYQKRNRRKWTAPNNGRSCDSIPKAIAISVELGLLPPDTIIPSGNPKKKRPISVSSSRPRKKINSEDASADAAEALLSMVTSSHQAHGHSAPPTGAASGSASLAPSIASSSGRDGTTAASKKASKGAPTMSNDPSDDDDDDEIEKDKGPPPVPMDPETTLDVYAPLPISRSDAALPTTVHWDPQGIHGRLVGWRVKIGNHTSSWMDGRVIRYDPHTHKHKIQYCQRSQSVLGAGEESSEKGRMKYAWIWLRNEKHHLQIATRMVWAHVKGYAWWPALVMESNQAAMKAKEGYVSIEFFGTGETSYLRDTPESIRPFDPKVIDPVVAKHRKKRNERAFQAAATEYRAIQATRHAAALYYARTACAMASYYAPKNANVSSISGPNGPALIGKRVQLFRSDVNYPYGDTVVGKVRQYSFFQKKWLISFEISEKQSQRAKYPPAWINVYGKDHALKILDKKTETETSAEDLVPFLFGFETADESVYNDDFEIGEGIGKGDILELKELLTSRCCGCVEYLKSSSIVPNSPNTATTKSSTMEQAISCSVCLGLFHLSCCDPPLSLDQWQRMMKDGMEYTCSRCIPCRGCYEKDIAFGSQAHPSPPTMLSPLQGGNDNAALLCLCSTCRQHYDAERFCPNCAHIWDDKRFRMVTRQIEYANAASKRRKKGSAKDLLEDSDMNVSFGEFEGDDLLPFEDKLHPSYFYPETTVWGFTEDEMLVCDSCNVWVHAGCSGMTEKEYKATSNGDHPIYSKEYFCRMCCRKRCRELIEGLRQEDRKSLFALPVSDRIVPNYHDMIKEPMDLQTMLEKVESEEYVNYAWVRELFELMVFNALTFNRIVSNTV